MSTIDGVTKSYRYLTLILRIPTSYGMAFKITFYNKLYFLIFAALNLVLIFGDNTRNTVPVGLTDMY